MATFSNLEDMMNEVVEELTDGAGGCDWHIIRCGSISGTTIHTILCGASRALSGLRSSEKRILGWLVCSLDDDDIPDDDVLEKMKVAQLNKFSQANGLAVTVTTEKRAKKKAELLSQLQE